MVKAIIVEDIEAIEDWYHQGVFTRQSSGEVRKKREEGGGWKETLYTE